MPVLAYFAIIAPALFGLLFLAGEMMGPPGPMPLTTSTTGLPAAFVAPKPVNVLTVRDGIVAEVPKGSDTYALAATSAPAAATAPAPAAAPAKVEVSAAAKVKVAKAPKKKVQHQQFAAQPGWQQQNQSWNGGWDQQSQQQPRRASRTASNRDGSNGRYAMSGQQSFFSPFGMIR